MSLPQFTDILSLSNVEISEAIIETENKLFNLRFKGDTTKSKITWNKIYKTSVGAFKNAFNITVRRYRTNRQN